MGWRGTVVLALCVALVAGYLWYEGPSRDDPASRALTFGGPAAITPAAPVRHLLDFNPADVVAVRLDHDGQTREAERNGETWRGAVTSSSITDFLNDLAEIGVLMEIPTGTTELQDYGLQAPRSVLQLRLRGRTQPLVLQIGDRNPATTGVYVRIGTDGPVVLAGALVASEFERAFGALGGANTNG